MLRWLLVLRLRLRSLFRGRAVDQDLDDELRDHLARQIEVGMVSGLTHEQARTAALRALGGLEPVKEQVRDTRRVGALEHLVRDLRSGLRVLQRSPSFTAVAVLSLALGIGANAAIFQLVNAVRLRPLPVDAPDELAIVRIAGRGWPPGNYGGRYPDVTYPIWEELRSRQQAFTSMAAWSQMTLDLAKQGESRFSENALFVSGEFFTLFGVRAAAGRLFAASDDVRGCPTPGVVLSHAFWQREFGGQRSVIGSTLTLNARPFVVLGVSAASFSGPEVGRSFDLAVPLCADAIFRDGGGRLDARREWWLSVFGRLREHWSLEAASAHLRTLSPTIFEATVPPRYPAKDLDAYRAYRLEAVPGASGVSNVRQEYDTSLWLLLTVAGVVLLIACANLANVLLARLGVREREMAVRLALGASRGRLIRQVLIESLLLSGAGAVVGAWLAPLLSHAIVALMSTSVDRLYVDLAIDWRLVLIAAALAVTTCLLFGLAPALRASRVPAIDAMRAGSRSQTTSRGHVRLRRLLVVAQVALSLTLLVGGLLFSRSLFNLLTVDAGFEPIGILEADLDLGRLTLAPDALAAVRVDLLGAVRALPDVQAAGSASQVPLVGKSYRDVFLDRTAEQPGEWVSVNRVSAGYFETMQITLSAGRDFDASDTRTSPPVAIVNEQFVDQFLGGQPAIGMTFQFGSGGVRAGPHVRIVGVVANTKYENLREPFRAIVYSAESQQPTPSPFQQILIQTAAPFSRVMPAVTAAISRVSPRASFHYHDFHASLRESLRRDQIMALLCGLFAVLAAILAATGVYGVLSYSVAQRTREIGLRLALGADHAALTRLVLREGLSLVGLGLLVGLGATAVAASAAEAWLFGLNARDPLVFSTATALLAAIAVAASYAPARRATRVDPMIALKSE